MLFDKSVKYSYAAQKTKGRKLRIIIFCFLGFLAVYLCLNALVFSMNALQSDAMQPGLRKGERFICSSYTIQSLFFRDGDTDHFPFARGDVVIIDPRRAKRRGFFAAAFDELLRFLTAQQFGLAGREERRYFKRVIGLPGDEVSMTNFVVRVKPAGGLYRLTEFEVAEKDYTPSIPQLPALWDETLPFSGNMETITLKKNECFVLSDDRANTNDSRTWGPLPLALVAGRVVFRYWPPTRMGRP
ncbi:MAG: signal peptidase I [Treponema sp.]|jgi:signal peptidase I|nr:signal peptidase I [Treponema sp.]